MERRLAAIMAADVVGFSRQMGADEAATLARIAALRADVLDPLLAEHRGRLFKIMGDGFLAEFASAVQAVACAVAVQARLAERVDGIRLRIGVHQGDVVVQGEDLMGDGVNIAARLEPLAEPGGIVISARVHEDLAGKLTVATEDMGEQTLKNIAAPIRAFRIRAAAGPEAGLALPEKPSIAVLAFTNMSGDVEQEYFADGIAEDIITALSHIRWLFVIARNSSFTYKGRAVDLKQVGRELGVRYILEGSVRRAANRLRVTVQLIEALTGTHLWAERYDRTLVDIFAIQDEITEAVARAIEPALAAAERQRARARPPESLGTWELYHRGLWHLYKFAPAENLLAIDFLERAAGRDPDFAAPRAALALAYYFQGWLYQPQERTHWLPRALRHGRAAVALDAQDAAAQAVLGLCLLFSGQHQAALAATAEAVRLNPNNAMAHGMHATALAFSGQPDEALPHAAEIARLSPVDPLLWIWRHWLSMLHFFRGDFPACAAAARDVVRMRPDIVNGHRTLAAALAAQGEMAEARALTHHIHAHFNTEMRAFLATRWEEFREADYTAYVTALAQAGLALSDGAFAAPG